MEKGWTQFDLSFATGIAQSTLSHIERGVAQVTPARDEHLQRIAEVLGEEVPERLLLRSTSHLASQPATDAMYEDDAHVHAEPAEKRVSTLERIAAAERALPQEQRASHEQEQGQ
jgi:transcriptional regulator with XRE-family HTH domain